MQHKLIKYTVENVKSTRFFQMPQFLFEGELKHGLTCEAKCLYMLLKDRHELSLANKWIDENNYVYLVYTRKEMSDMLGVAEKTAIKVIGQLKAAGLIEEKRQGLNRPNKIYLTSIIEGTNPVIIGTCKKDSSGYEENFGICKDDSSGHVKKTVPELYKLQPNKTEYNKTNINKTNLSIYQEEKETLNLNSSETIDTIDENITELEERKYYEQYIKQNISYDIIADRYNNYSDQNFLDGVINIILDAICSKSTSIKISKDLKPKETVKNQLLKIDESHIEYLHECLKNTTTKIKNISSYILTSLYNSVNTMDIHYTQMINHDSLSW